MRNVRGGTTLFCGVFQVDVRKGFMEREFVPAVQACLQERPEKKGAIVLSVPEEVT